MGSSVRIYALLRAEILVTYALFVMQNYLTDVWGLSFTRAAAIVNIWSGISNVLPVFILLLVTLLGNFKMLLITSIAYSVGIGFVTMSTPPVFANSTGTCKEYKKECIGGAQKSLFHTGMALIAIGIAGNLVCAKALIEEQKDQADHSIIRGCLRRPGRIIVTVVSLIAALALPYINPWSLRFGIPALCTAVATLLFLSGTLTYHKAEPQGNPVRDICRVFVAAASKRSQPLPDEAERIYKKVEEKEPSTGSLRCLEKAAIILQDVSLDEQKKNEWKLCSAAEVEDAKIIVRLVPIWTTFIICGIVSSIGNTYFLEQANHMNRKIGPVKVPLQVLLLVFKMAKYLFAFRVGAIMKKKSTTAPLYGIAAAMVFSVLCCITAAGVETKRLNLIRRTPDPSNPPDPSKPPVPNNPPMSTFWLLFQFVLLAGLDSYMNTSVAAFYNDQLPDPLKKFVHIFATGVTGLGFIFNVLSVYVVGKISESVSKANWFQESLAESRLDRYYWVLAALSSVNLVVFILLAAPYRYKNRELEEQGKQNSSCSILRGYHLCLNEDDCKVPVPAWFCCGCCCCSGQ